MRPYILAAASAAAILWSIAPTPTWSQEALNLGSTTQGALNGETSSTTGAGGYRYRDYSLSLREGQRIEAILRSEDFDPVLGLYAAGAVGDPLSEDDDGLGEGANSRLRFTVPSSGDYVLRVRTYDGTDGGDYSLVLAERPPAPRAPRPGRIATGRTVNGELRAGDAEEDDVIYDAYAFRARAGERLAIGLESDDFDSLLAVGRAVSGGGFSELARNDDGPGRGLHSYIVFTAPEAGDYLIRTMSLSNDTGRYRLSLAEGPAPLPATPLAFGGSERGVLSGDNLGAEGRPAQRYGFSGRQGQRVAISASSSDFDTFLQLYDSAGASLAENDDGSDGTNSRIVHVLPADGDYAVEIRAFSDGDGDFRVELEELAPPKPPAPVALGAKVEGELTEDDDIDNSGQRFDSYVFTAGEGQRIQAIVRSGDFDTVVQIGAGGADEFDVLGSDDDGLGEGTDSRLTFVVPDAGEYVVRVLSWDEAGRGLYALELVDRGPEPTPGSILVGATARGALTEADAIADDGAYFDAYRFEAKDGEKLRFTMISNAFDATVQVGRDEGESFAPLASDDDGLSDTHARLDWTAPDDGTYMIRARSFASGETGDYVLMVERQP